MVDHHDLLLREVAQIQLQLYCIAAVTHQRQAGIREVAERLVQRAPLFADRDRVLVMGDRARDWIADQVDELCVRHERLDPLRDSLPARVVGVAGRCLAAHRERRVEKGFVLIEPTDPRRHIRVSVLWA